ncbi:hypothetical protein ABKN59_011714, partial [Abortiporus biennis]
MAIPQLAAMPFDLQPDFVAWKDKLLASLHNVAKIQEEMQLEAELEIARTEIERLEQVNAELKRDAKKPELSALRIGHSIHSSVSSNSSPKSLSRSIRGTRREQSTRDASIHHGPRKQSLWEKGPVRGDDAMSVDEQSRHSEALGSEVPTEEGNATISIHIRNPLRQNELERWEFDS